MMLILDVKIPTWQFLCPSYIFASAFHRYRGTYESVFLEKVLRFQTSYSMVTINIPDFNVLYGLNQNFIKLF